MKLHPLLALLAFTLAAERISILAAVQPDVAEITFGKPSALPEPPLPAWIAKVEHQGGQLLDAPRCWQVGADALAGAGRVSVAINRSKMNEDLVATILFDSDDTADLAVQLFDAQGRVVVVDLFGNLVDVSKEAITNTFVVPLRKYPTAERIVVRRVKGEVKVYGIVLYPIVTEGEPNDNALRKLAAVLGDPLSAENPLLTSLQKIARNGELTIDPSIGATPKTPATAVVPVKRSTYPGAVPPPAGARLTPVPSAGLVAWWNFDRDDATDFSGRNHHGILRGGFELADGIHGRALRLHRGLHGAVLVPPARDLELKDSLTVSGWIKYSGNAGSQIVWFGDAQKGRDPWLLCLLGDKRLRLRSDRSVTA